MSDIHINPATWKAESKGSVLYPRLDELMTGDELQKFLMYLPEDQVEMIQEIGGVVIAPIKADENLLAVIKSGSRPGVYHQIRWGGGKTYIWCSCESYEFGGGAPCRHMKDWAKEYGPIELNSVIGEQICKILGVS